MCSFQAEQLAAIIKDYRKGELSIPIDKAHVIKWLSQFSEEHRDSILAETLHVLSKWYFDINHIREFLRKVYDYVNKTYGCLSNVEFLNCQQEGKSQEKLIDELCNMQATINNGDIHSNVRHLIYIDDGLYSGRHIIKDVENILSLPKYRQVISIDIFVMIGYSAGIQYVISELEPLCNQRSIKLALYKWRALSNNKEIRYYDNGEEFCTLQDTIWPLHPMPQTSDDIKDRIETVTGKKLHYCYGSMQKSVGFWISDVRSA